MVEIVCSPPKQLVVLECTQYASLEAAYHRQFDERVFGRPRLLDRRIIRPHA